jgi:hypothetical protein
MIACILPGCQRIQRQRGVCRRCLQQQYRLIQAKLVTDAELVALGQRLPAKPRSQMRLR